MEWHHKIKSVFILASIIMMAVYMKTSFNPTQPIPTPTGSKFKGPPCVRVYNAIEKYAPQNDIPKRIAYNVAYHETGYRGPLDLKYKGSLTSSAGAEGPMQIMVSTAEYIEHRKVTREELRTNVELNVRVSMELLHQLKKQYGSWEVALGYYNSGYPIINDYARSIAHDKVNLKLSI